MKKPIRLLAIAAIAASFAFALPFKKSKQVHVVIDAAHGGKDYGSVHGKFIEKEIAHQVALRIKDLNTDAEVVLHFSRDQDTFLDLQNRIAVVNDFKADLVLSLHTNYSAKDENKRGMELFVTKAPEKYEQAATYANGLLQTFTAKGYTAEVKQAPFYLLKNSDAPAVMIEMGYLSNARDREYLTTPAGQDAIAGAVLDFIKTLK